jgi:pimeloyl-ACP methyl ester carboxylesterase
MMPNEASAKANAGRLQKAFENDLKQCCLWDQFTGDRFADLKGISHPTLVVNGINDEMIPVRNSYWLSENLSNAVLLTYPDSGHGSLFQFTSPLRARPRPS